MFFECFFETKEARSRNSCRRIAVPRRGQLRLFCWMLRDFDYFSEHFVKKSVKFDENAGICALQEFSMYIQICHIFIEMCLQCASKVPPCRDLLYI